MNPRIPGSRRDSGDPARNFDPKTKPPPRGRGLNDFSFQIEFKHAALEQEETLALEPKGYCGRMIQGEETKSARFGKKFERQNIRVFCGVVIVASANRVQGPTGGTVQLERRLIGSANFKEDPASAGFREPLANLRQKRLSDASPLMFNGDGNVPDFSFVLNAVGGDKRHNGGRSRCVELGHQDQPVRVIVKAFVISRQPLRGRGVFSLQLEDGQQIFSVEFPDAHGDTFPSISPASSVLPRGDGYNTAEVHRENGLPRLAIGGQQPRRWR